jgi:hypothetical protein
VVSRRAVVATGSLVVATYVALAVASGSISPLARGPLLDGLGPLAPYRWVAPPPELAATNQPPSRGRFDVTLGNQGSEAATFVLSDNQVTLILPEGVFRAKRAQIQVRLRVDPVDPATLGPPPAGRTVFGNAYRLSARYVPSGEPVQELRTPIDAFLTYPVTATLTSANHQVATSADGRAWTMQEGTDAHALQQVEGPVPDLGYAVVVGVPGSPAASASGGASGSRTLAIGLIVAAVCVGLVGVGLLLRSRDRGGARRRSSPGRSSGRR